MAYITGQREFWSLDFLVTQDVLVPRPETELIVEVALGLIEKSKIPNRKFHVLDLGTGSGAIAVSLAKELSAIEIWATDLSPAALAIARINAARHGVEEKICFLQGDLFEPVRDQRGFFHMVVSNPPYVRSHELGQLQPEVSRYEPRIALDGGPDGLMYHRRIITESPRFLKPGGLLTLEVGIGQAEAVVSSIEENGAYDTIEIVKDYAWHDRVVLARKRR